MSSLGSWPNVITELTVHSYPCSCDTKEEGDVHMICCTWRITVSSSQACLDTVPSLTCTCRAKLKIELRRWHFGKSRTWEQPPVSGIYQFSIHVECWHLGSCPFRRKIHTYTFFARKSLAALSDSGYWLALLMLAQCIFLCTDTKEQWESKYSTGYPMDNSKMLGKSGTRGGNWNLWMRLLESFNV